MKHILLLWILQALFFSNCSFATEMILEDHGKWITFSGKSGIGKGKHIVFVSGDEEYRSEEACPQLAKIMASHHGFKCTVLFAIDEKGEINPNHLSNIPGLENLETADLMVLFIRFRNLPEKQCDHIQNYLNAGKPIVGLRPSCVAFKFKDQHPYQHWDWKSKVTGWEGGFGQIVLGQSWYGHHGKHKVQGTRGVIPEDIPRHPIVQGCEDLWGPSDVYRITELEGDAKPIIMGQVICGLDPSSPPDESKELMPLAWTKTYTPESGKTLRIFNSTIGSSIDLKSEGVRRLIVNGSLWALGMENDIQPRTKVDTVEPFEPTFFGFNTFNAGLKPAFYLDVKPEK